MKHSISVFLALFLMGSGMVLSAQTLTVVFEEWPPYEFTSGETVVGTDAEIIKEAAKRLGYTLKFTSMPWARAVQSVTDGTADAIISISKNPEREGFLAFPATQLNGERKVLFTLKSAKMSVTKLSDLAGLTVGVVRGNSYGKEFDAQTAFTKFVVNDQETLIKMLVGKRFEAAITSDLVGFDVARKLSIADQVAAQPLIVQDAPLYIAFSKAKGPTAEKMAVQFSQMLDKLKADGFTDKVFASYKK